MSVGVLHLLQHLVGVAQLARIELSDQIDEGMLQLWAAAGWLPTAWEEQVSASFRIEVPSGRMRAAIDGEPVLLDSPLELESLPQALRVLVPGSKAE